MISTDGKHLVTDRRRVATERVNLARARTLMLALVIASLGAAALAAIAAPAMDGAYICDLSERSEALAQETRERKEAQAILVHTQKMQSIGLLAAGVTGDFNNLKTIVFDNLDSIEPRLAHFQPENVAAISRPIAAALRGARRAASLTRRLLAFSRQQVLTPTVGRSEPTGRGLSDMLTRTIGETIARHLPARVDFGVVPWPRLL